MSIRHVSALALCVACGAALAQNTDVDAHSRQQRMDSAYNDWQQHQSHAGAYNTGSKSARHGTTHHESAASNGGHASVGQELKSYGHSFMTDVKKAPHQLAEAGRETGHSIAEAAREQGRDAKAAAHDAKKSVSGGS
jgi:hypothetical protein